MASELIKDPLNIIICGVGGQGNILASELFASSLVEKGYYVTIGETYGASQRGGSVMSHIRISQNIQRGPLIPANDADIICGFEPIETLRIVREYGNSSCIVIYDNRPNYPLGVLSGEATYPPLDEIDGELRKLAGNVQVIEATALALEAGNQQAANIALMGALTGLNEIPLEEIEFAEVLKKRFDGRALDLNRQVFNLGYKRVKNETSPTDKNAGKGQLE